MQRARLRTALLALVLGLLLLGVAAVVAATPLRARDLKPPTSATATTAPVVAVDPQFTDTDRGTPRTLDRPLRVAMFADSLGVEALPHLEAVVGEKGWQLHFDGHGGTATCDYLPAMRTAAADLAPDVVVVQFSGNALTECISARAGGNRAIVGGSGTGLDLERFAAAYRGDTVAAIDAFGPDVDVILVAVPLTRRGSAAAASRLDEIYRDLAAAHPRVHHLSLDRLLTPGHRYADVLPCLPGEPCEAGSLVPVRHPDGGHLCAATPSFCFGGRRFAWSVVDGIQQLVATASASRAAPGHEIVEIPVSG